MKGEWPPCQVDHEDTNKRNNRWTNLRLATGSQNQANRSAVKNNALGAKGVERTKSGKFRARLKVAGNNQHLGTFNTIAEASAAYAAAARQTWGEFARW